MYYTYQHHRMQPSAVLLLLYCWSLTCLFRSKCWFAGLLVWIIMVVPRKIARKGLEIIVMILYWWRASALQPEISRQRRPNHVLCDTGTPLTELTRVHRAPHHSCASVRVSFPRTGPRIFIFPTSILVLLLHKNDWKKDKTSGRFIIDTRQKRDAKAVEPADPRPLIPRSRPS